MKVILGRYTLYICLFLILQLISRCIFIFHDSLQHQLTESVFSTFRQGFALDLAFTCYMLGLFLLYDIVFPYAWTKLRSISFFILSFLVVFLSFSDRYLFDVWSSKFNQDALHFMQHPKEAMASTGHLPVLKIFIISLAISVILYLVFKFFLGYLKLKISALPKWMGLLLLAVFIGLGARQSLSVSPIGPSAAYYSKNPANNNASLNSAWNFIYQCFMPTEYVDLEKYNFFSASNHQQKAEEYYFKSDTIPFTFDHKPNVVLIVLESFNAYLSKHYGGVLDHTPFLDSLSKTGISFTNCYAGSNRTDKALACINSGYPGTPWNSILSQPEKAVKLPQLSNLFKQKGYTNTFAYGGDLSFASMETYLQAGSFDRLLDIDHFKPLSQINLSKWGTHDEVVFNAQAQETKKEPFFEEILSLSSHEPFDVPYQSTQTDEKYGPFYNSVQYTDACLKAYFTAAQSKKWFNNTIFIFVSDHGRDIGVDRENPTDSIRYKVPILMWGKPLKGKVLALDEETSQTDLANTIALLFELDSTQKTFPFSRNLFSSRDAFFFTNGGWGFMNQNRSYLSFQNKYYMSLDSKKREGSNARMEDGAAIQYKLLNYYKNL